MHFPDRYILYRLVCDAQRGKFKKIPCDHTGANIDPHDPAQWRPYADRAQYATWDESRPDAPYGVGFVLNGDGIFFLDLDNCLGDDGQWSPDATLIYTSFGGALGEVSTSQKGLHIFGRCDPSQVGDLRNKWDGDKEFYTDKRFVALSRKGPEPIGGTCTDKDWSTELRALVPQRELPEGAEWPEGVDPTYTGPDDDAELLRLAHRSSSAAAKFGAKATFSDLWSGDGAALGRFYPDPEREFDHSAADMALMNLLAFWTGRDAPRMDRLFRRSKLMREKYDRRADYRRETIGKAARLCKKVYDHPLRAGNDLTTADGAEEVTTSDLSKWNLANAMHVLRTDAKMRDVFAYDVMLGKVIVTKPVPGSREPEASFRPRTLQDNDYTHVVAWFNRGLYPRATVDVTTRAVEAIARENSHDPVRMYLEDLTWDGTPRLDTMFAVYFGASSDDAFARVASRKFMISGVARAVKPGCKVDTMPILEGRQGIGKSSAVAALFGREYFGDHLPDTGSKDAADYVRGKWCIEVAELDSVRRSAVESAKAFFSRQVERFRPAYGRNEIEYPRRNVFVGTTNADNYLKDNTGNRRYWPIALDGHTDVEAIMRDRDQLWAEAYSRFRSGEQWWLTPEESAMAAAAAEERVAADPWEEVVAAWCELHNVNELTVSRVLGDALGIPAGQQKRTEEMRLADVLKRLGFKKHGGRINGRRKWVKQIAANPASAGMVTGARFVAPGFSESVAKQ